MVDANDAEIPPCAALPLHSTTGLSATDVGCVSTTTGGVTTASRPHVIYIPDLPHFAPASSH